VGSEGEAAGHIAGYDSARVSVLDLASIVVRVVAVVVKNTRGMYTVLIQSTRYRVLKQARTEQGGSGVIGVTG
jgi:hypothetical protein